MQSQCNPFARSLDPGSCAHGSPALGGGNLRIARACTGASSKPHDTFSFSRLSTLCAVPDDFLQLIIKNACAAGSALLHSRPRGGADCSPKVEVFKFKVFKLSSSSRLGVSKPEIAKQSRLEFKLTFEFELGPSTTLFGVGATPVPV